MVITHANATQGKSTQQRPSPHTGLRHVALYVQHFDACLAFYTQLLGLRIEWQPDADNVFLTSGNDNLALHRAPAALTAATSPGTGQARLDHIGFILQKPEQVDEWHNFLVKEQVAIQQGPKTHRDGARSLYCTDPDGNTVQMIFHPPLAGPN